jgi:hypothetical protein
MPQLWISRNLSLIFQNIRTDPEEAVLVKVLNFLVVYLRSNLDMICAVESVVSRLPRTLDMEYKRAVRSTLEKS